MAHQLHLITIWAKFEDGHGYSGAPQFVAAFPSSLADAMCELYAEWLKVACENYRNEVDLPVVGFFEGRASIDRPPWDTLHLVEDDAINPGWDEGEGERCPCGAKCDPGQPYCPSCLEHAEAD